jgi:thiosulfate reductase cytochrome b subunit
MLPNPSLLHDLLLTSANDSPSTMPAGTIQVHSVAEWLLSPA